ncbi:MAG: superoxide dismutase [Ni], partial [Gemmatimonadales bacterium]
MSFLTRLFAALDRVSPPATASAHCDLPCGLYDPAQARIEAEALRNIQQKYQDSNDEAFRTRALMIKEERAEEVKHHLWV